MRQDARGAVGVTVALVLAIATLAGAVAGLWRHNAAGDEILVIMYHHLAPDPGDSTVIVSPERFAEQMRWFAANGFTTITTADLRRYFAGQAELPPRPLLITFDDGYLSQYELAYPILAQYDMKATFFVVARWTDVPFAGDALARMSWEHLRELQATGLIEIESHSYDLHHYAGPRPAALALGAEEVLADLVLSRDRLRVELDHNARALAWPFGAYNERTNTLAQKAGFDLAFGVQPGYVTRATDPLALPRFNMPQTYDSARLTELFGFRVGRQ